MKRRILAQLCALMAVMAQAQTVTDIDRLNLAGPYAVQRPVGIDTVGVDNKPFDEARLLGAVPLVGGGSVSAFGGSVLPSLAESESVGVLSFYINNTEYVSGKLNVKGPKVHKVYLDGRELQGTDLKLSPAHHAIAVKYLAAKGACDSFAVSIDAPQAVGYTLSEKHPLMLHDMMDGKRVTGSQISPDGKFVLIYYSEMERGGRNRGYSQLKEVVTGRVLTERYGLQWMPKTVACLYDETQDGNRRLYRLDPKTGSTTLLAENLPGGSYTMSDTEDYLVFANTEDGPTEDSDIVQIIHPDDRQPGWRNRAYLIKYDLKTGITQQLTFGSHSSFLYDISADGRRLLVGVRRMRLTKRPIGLTDVLIIDAATLKADTVFRGGEYIGSVKFSPDARQLLVTGAPEAFGGIGKNVPEGIIPSQVDGQLYLYDIAARSVRPMTRMFNPSCEEAVWSKKDGLIYIKTTDRDYVNLYVLNPESGSIRRVNTADDVITHWHLPSYGPAVSYVATGVLTPPRLFVLNLKSGKSTLLDDCAKEQYAKVEMGECRDWNFVSARGDTICGRYYLPPHFDESKKYPMIVNYYGGCSPTDRRLESRYPAAYYASMGYVVYVVQPSGCTGFGQEFSARHVNTWGKGVAEDIIEGTKRICAAHPFIDSSKIGCIGASYGGFMTQYLQTVTDIFACAVSHAGISNITSYWGEGYWGYSYSEIASSDRFPWNAGEMYTAQSPLFNADKIHTPLLLLHGAADTNVPIIESIQMFTALQLLGRDVAFVQVPGENHWILDYTKRLKWSDTTMAWFAKYLKNDDTWWYTLYPKKEL
jgi:dipeptidyl aminopeptidase/acylaminoacyl peptidase